MITLASLLLFIVAGVVGLALKYTAPKCEAVLDLMGIA